MSAAFFKPFGSGVSRLLRNVRFQIRNVAVLIFVLVSGCGKSDGPPPVPREEVDGKVVFDSKPLPFGHIEFRNEELKVSTRMTIRDGAFSSPSGEGPAAGRNKVYIVGAPQDGDDVMPLWQGSYKTEVEIKQGKNSGTEISIDKKAIKPFDPKNWGDNIHDRSS